MATAWSKVMNICSLFICTNFTWSNAQSNFMINSTKFSKITLVLKKKLFYCKFSKVLEFKFNTEQLSATIHNHVVRTQKTKKIRKALLVQWEDGKLKLAKQCIDYWLRNEDVWGEDGNRLFSCLDVLPVWLWIYKVCNTAWGAWESVL